MPERTDKAFRLLQMHERLSKGETIVKSTALDEFSVPTKTFQRDIDDLRQYYTEQGSGDLIYDRKNNYYRLDARSSSLTKQEIFAICKILVESRAFNKAEFDMIIGKLLLLCDADESKALKALLANELVNYLPLQHGKLIVNVLWELSDYVATQNVIKFTYKRLDGVVRTHEVKPVGIMFSEFYFYLIGYMADDSKKFPTVFRVDRMSEITRLDAKFAVPYAERFSEAEFRKRIQFMYSGELRRLRFRFKGNLEAMLDRLPTAKVESQTDDGAIIRAEAYGTGIDMWLKSQGDRVEML